MDAIITFGGSFVGALTFAYTDSHWFNAVEAEVYGFSTFFTAIVVWLILHWQERADEKGNERYILIIAYMIGLATGIHLLNLLTLPFIALIIYFRKYEFSYKGFLITSVITGAVFLVINTGIINGMPKLVNAIGLNLVVVLSLIIVGGMIFTIIQKQFRYALALTSIVLILIGYSSYATIFIRSGQQPAINENDPSTVPRAIAYMEREQYGQMFHFPAVIQDYHQNMKWWVVLLREVANIPPVRNENINRIGWISSGVISGITRLRKCIGDIFYGNSPGEAPVPKNG
jgi:hypothetical protein